MYRIGIGHDTHRLEPGNGLWLGGLKIPHSKSAVGHSDADVLLHAVTDALLGAARWDMVNFSDMTQKIKIGRRVNACCKWTSRNGWNS